MFGMVAFCALWLAAATAFDRMRANGRGAIQA
jgi:hypothetical protein